MAAAPTAEIATQLVARALAGDVLALEQIILAYNRDMARICVIVTGDPSVADDAVQSAWELAWRKLHTLRDAERLRPWLMAIAANEARAIVRRQRRHVVVEIDVADVGVHDHDPAGWTERADLRSALRRLSPDDRTILALRYIADVDFAEVGRAVGLSASGARTRHERLLGRLRTELQR